jgi:hypothetical protein
MNLLEKLLTIRKSMTYFKKDTQGFGYMYVAGVDVLGAWREKADELGVLLITSVKNSRLTETQCLNDKQQVKIGRIIQSEILFKFLDVESGEKLEVPFDGFGEQTDASKAFGSMLTYCERYFLLKFNNVPTDKDDPDAKDTREAGHKAQGATKKPETVKDTPRGTQAATGQEKTENATALGDKLSTSHYISDNERAAWEKKKGDPASRSKAIDYMLEKIRYGEEVERRLYMEAGAHNDGEHTMAEIKAEVREVVIKRYAQLPLPEAKKVFPEPQWGKGEVKKEE